MKRRSNKEKKNHFLIVGGSGMLKGVAVHFASEGHNVSVVGRDAGKLAHLVDEAKDANGSIQAVKADYTHATSFFRSVREVIDRIGPVSCAIVWIHSTAPRMPLQLANFLSTHPCQFVHILGSSGLNAGKKADLHQAEFNLVPGIEYTQVLLGYRSDERGKRWLTDEEICRGVIEAVHSDPGRFLVGILDPWPQLS